MLGFDLPAAPQRHLGDAARERGVRGRSTVSLAAAQRLRLPPAGADGATGAAIPASKAHRRRNTTFAVLQPAAVARQAGALQNDGGYPMAWARYAGRYQRAL